MSWLRWLRRLLRFGRQRGTAPVPTATTEVAAPGLPTTRVVIGLDFGTSGTKVVVRLLDKGRPTSAIDFGTDQPGFSRFSFPSTIALENSCFLLGVDAEKHQHGPVFRSLKRTLISTNGDVRRARSLERCPRPQNLDEHPHFLVAVYLGTVLRRVRKLVADEYDTDAECYYNLDIPVSQLDDGPVQRGFQTALDAAVDFAETDGLRLDDYRTLWGRWLEVLGRDSTGAADRERKRWELIPESSAIVKGAEAALASILPDSRRYTAIVDVGAGTTDVGWFRWVTREEGDRLYFFSARTCLVGCDEVDDGLLDILAVPDSDRPRLFPMVRAAKPELGAEQSVDVGEGYRHLTPGDLGRAVHEMAGRCFEEYGVSFGEAYTKDRNTDHWKDIRMILVGGGSQLDGLRHQFRHHPRWESRWSRDVSLLLPGNSASVGSSAARTLRAMGATSDPPGHDDVVFLLPALGLSYPAEEIPEPGLPDGIPPSPPPPRGPTGVYAYEAPDDD